MTSVLPSHRFMQRFSLLIVLILTLFSPSKAQECSHGGGLWGSAKDTLEPIVQPVKESLASNYGNLSDKGRFLAGACAGFGASKFAVRSTVKTVKTVGAAYIAFEALEYAGLLKEARTSKRQKILAESRDYFLRTVDGMRHDIRTQLHPKKIQSRIKNGMEKDKPGTVGFGTGAFLGFVL